MPFTKAFGLFRRANSNKGRIVRALKNTGRSGFWAMADQGVASIGNFGIFFLLGREFARRGQIGEFANFGMLYELMWFLNSMHSALIVYPLTVQGAKTDRAELARIAGICAILTLAIGPVLGGTALGMAAVISTVEVGLWAALAAVTWQVQETVRRALMAELRFRAAIWGDCIRYLGHVGAVWMLARGGFLTLENVFQMMIAASALAAVLQALQLGVRIPGISAIVGFAREAWKLGRWVLAGNTSNVCTTTLYTINFRFWQGAELVGVAFALNNLLRLTNPLMFTVTSLVTPHAARARAESGIAASKRVLLKFGLLGLLLLMPYLLVLILFPNFCIRLATDPAYQKYWWVLVLSATTQGLIYIGTVLGVYLNAVERNRRAFIGQLVYSGGFLLVGMPATAIIGRVVLGPDMGILGPVLGGLVGSVLMVLVNLDAVRKLPASEKPVQHDNPQRGFEPLPPNQPRPAPAT